MLDFIIAGADGRRGTVYVIQDAFINIKYMIPTYESCVLN
jgi:hypothetical protein